jgi:DUF1680 family protein
VEDARGEKMKRVLMLICSAMAFSAIAASTIGPNDLRSVPVEKVIVTDSFWAPRLQLFRTTTINDVFTKFEGYHDSQISQGDAFSNFDRVAQGQLGAGGHVGDPWWDGLIYESIRAAADFLKSKSDAALEGRVDAYIHRIKAASDSDPDGYINTSIQLANPPNQRFMNGFFHESYNAGCLAEAGIHYYQATGKTELLYAACRFANYLCSIMGPGKANYVPEHAIAEEAFIKLYQLFKSDASLKNKLSPLIINEDNYRALVEFWIENRGNHANRLNNMIWNSPDIYYAQDHDYYYNQKTCAGHAVRATLFYTGIIACGRENGVQTYLASAQTLWDDMIGKQMYLTGGLGSTSGGEAFGGDYHLPNDGYCETCASVGGGFYCQRMNMAFADGKYTDILETELYNGILGGIGLQGTTYYYQQPLVATDYSRWNWHPCPCCPPMFLKIMSEMPGYIYSHCGDSVYANLFVGSNATVSMPGYDLTIRQTTGYPWLGTVTFHLSLQNTHAFGFLVRIPAWSKTTRLILNGQSISPSVNNGYACINRTWKNNDSLQMTIDMTPQRAYADLHVAADAGRVGLRRGPIVYCLEGVDNHYATNGDYNFDCYLPKSAMIHDQYEPTLLGGIYSLNAQAVLMETDAQNAVVTKSAPVKAIPFYARANRTSGKMNVWIAEDSTLAVPSGVTFAADTTIYYHIVNRLSGKAISTVGNASADETDLVLGTIVEGNYSQQWHLRPLNNGDFEIINRDGSNAISCQSGDTAQGTAVHLWTYLGPAADQDWQIVSVGSGYYKIVNRLSNNAISCKGAGTTDSTILHLWNYLGSAADQDWQLVPIEPPSATKPGRRTSGDLPEFSLCRYSKGIVIRWNKPLSGLKPSIRIFDLHGAFVKELRLDSRIKKEAFWNGTTEMGLKVASGSYVISIENGKKVFGRILATIVNP